VGGKHVAVVGVKAFPKQLVLFSLGYVVEEKKWLAKGQETLVVAG
jgi:hypothetical protein